MLEGEAPVSQEDGHGWHAPGGGAEPVPDPERRPEEPPNEPSPPEQGWSAPQGENGRPQLAPPDPPAGYGAPGHGGHGSGYGPGYGPGYGSGYGPPPGPGYGPGYGPPTPPEVSYYGAPPAPSAGYGAPGHGGHGSGYGPPPPGYGGPPPGYGPSPGWGQPQAPKPGIVALRPLGLGDIFNGAFGYIRENPKATLGLSLIVMAVVSVLPSIASGMAFNDFLAWEEQLDATAEILTPEDLFPYSTTSMLTELLGFLVSLAGSVVLTGLLTSVIAMAVLGHRLTLSQAWRHARGRLPALAVLTLLVLLVAITFSVLLFLVIGFAVAIAITVDPLLGVAVGFLGIVAWLPLAAWIYVKVALASPAVILERMGPGAALARSWRLIAGSWWRVFGILLLTTVLVSVVGGVLSMPFQIASSVVVFVGEGATWEGPALVGSSFVGTVLAGTITVPFTAGVTVLLYIDLRMRREGLDLHLRTVGSTAERMEDAYGLATSGSHGGSAG